MQSKYILWACSIMILSVQMSVWIHGFPDTLQQCIKACAMKKAVSCFASRPTHKIHIFFHLDSILQGSRLLRPIKEW